MPPSQICVAPDYVLIPRNKQDEFVAAMKEHYKSFYPEGALKSADYGRIVNAQHHARLQVLLERTNGKVVMGGEIDERKGFEPTVVQDVREQDSLLEEYVFLSIVKLTTEFPLFREIFGPILPLVHVDNVAAAIDFINSRYAS